VDKIGLVIGPGGKTIRKIIEETGVKVDVEDDGSIFIASTDAEGSQKAIEMIQALTEEPEIGKIYTGTVRRVTDFEPLSRYYPGQMGWCTSLNWLTIMCPVSRTWCVWATRSWSWS
jgi:Polyribonucleotide nucleotidyltransferase (polynucleotide phosphorylase)